MANEFKHKDPGVSLTQAEFIASSGDGHIFACQATGDILYASSTTVLKNLAKGAANTVLHMGGSCIPAWTASPSVTDLTVSGGCIVLTGAATDIDLIDNNASALSFDASGKTGIIDIVTTNCSEGVTMSGTLGVTGALTATAGFTSSAASTITTDADSEFIGLKLTNQSDSANTCGFVSLAFDLEDTGGNAVDSAKISVKKEASFTATASTQDSSIEFHTSLNGTLAEKMTINSAGNVCIGGDLTVTGGCITLAGSLIFSGGDTTSLNLIDAIDATTEATIEGAIDTLSNLTTVGALNAGSITSGFGTIDTGSSAITTTGLITGGTFSTGNSGTAKFLDGNGSHYFTLAAHATTTASVDYTWPAADGSSGQVLSTNSSGVLSWASAGGPCQATKSELECRDNLDKYAPPDLMQHHPGVAKVWANVNMNLTTIVNNASYNVTSINDCGTGKLKLTIATDFANAHYVAAGMMTHPCAACVHGYIHGFDSDASCTRTAGIFVVQGFSMNGAGDAGEARDAEDFDIVIFGTQ